MTRIHLPVPSTRPDQTLTRFEERFVYRISRGVPVGLAAMAGMVLVVAAMALLYTLVPSREVREPAPALVPDEVVVSLEEVRQAVSEWDGRSAVVADTTMVAGTAAAPRIDPSWIALADRVHAIRLLFPAPAYAWTDRYESYCADRYYGYCFRTERRRVAEGVSSLVHAAVSMFDDGGEMQRIPESATRPEVYSLNVTNLPRKLAGLQELEGIVAAVPVEQRRTIASGWIALRSTREAERNAQIAAEQARVARERAAEEARYALAETKRASLRSMSVSGIGAAIGTIWLLGLTLALLAIERNTRQLRATAPTASAAVAPRPSPMAEPAVR